MSLLDGRPKTSVSRRVLTAVKWYNRANQRYSDEEVALVHLATAFESLLGLSYPAESAKARDRGGVTERFRESINLLVGNVANLSAWLDQFYAARSKILHEGRTENLRYIVGKDKDKQPYQPLLSYGRQVFQLCVPPLLLGAQLAEEARLAEKLVTNQQRYTSLCQLFGDGTISSLEKLERAANAIEAIRRYTRFREPGLRTETMLGCARSAVRTLLESGVEIFPELGLPLASFNSAGKSSDHFDELEALRAIYKITGKLDVAQTDPLSVVVSLLNSVWRRLMAQHHSLMRKREKKTEEESGQQ